MRKVLLPFDGSASAMHAVHYAAALAQESQALHLVLLHVLDPVTLGPHAALSQHDIEQLHAADMASMLAPARQVLDQAGVPYETHCRAGSASSRIADYVHESGCQAIIMGTRGLGPVASLLIGSVAIKVIHLVNVPVTLVK